MLRWLIVLCSIATVTDAVLACPTGFSLVLGKCVYPLALNSSTYQFPLSTQLPVEMAKCEDLGGRMPIIKSDKDNTDWNNVVKQFSDNFVDLVLGMVCNPTTKRLEWEDKSKITYSRSPLNYDFDCTTQHSRVVSQVHFDNWVFLTDGVNAEYHLTYLCEVDATDVTVTSNCGLYDELEQAADGNKPCFKIYAIPNTAVNAHAKCVEDGGEVARIYNTYENNFIRRTAVGQGLVNNASTGIYIGAIKKPDGQWTWIDGDVPFDPTGTGPENFNMFDKNGPDGDCAVLMIANQESLGVWEKTYRDNQEKLPFVCRRAKFPSPGLPTVTENEAFISPGFPHSIYPWNQLLTVNPTAPVEGCDSGQCVVELQVLFLNAVYGVDFLQIYEGLGSNLLANLTGATPAAPHDRIRTVSSNQMRIEWHPQNTTDFKGFQLIFTSINK